MLKPSELSLRLRTVLAQLEQIANDMEESSPDQDPVNDNPTNDFLTRT